MLLAEDCYSVTINFYWKSISWWDLYQNSFLELKKDNFTVYDLSSDYDYLDPEHCGEIDCQDNDEEARHCDHVESTGGEVLVHFGQTSFVREDFIVWILITFLMNLSLFLTKLPSSELLSTCMIMLLLDLVKLSEQLPSWHKPQEICFSSGSSWKDSIPKWCSIVLNVSKCCRLKAMLWTCRYR